MDTEDFLDQAPLANDQSINVGDAVLTEQEQELVLKAWQDGKTSLKEIIQYSCGPGIDGRSKKGIAVKDFLANHSFKARPAQIYKKKTDNFVLTEDQKEFIANNVASMKMLEIVRTIFDNAQLTTLSAEFRAAKEFYDTLDSKVKTTDNDDIDLKEYNPPKTDVQAIARINRYVLGGIDTERITPRQKECVVKLIRYMHTFRFLFEIRSLIKGSEREMFESSFVRYTWDKPDLTEEDIDLYLNLCSEQILFERMKKELIFLTEHRDIMMSEENGKIQMPMIEAIGKLRTDLDSSSKKQEKTLQGLNGRRDKRLEKISSDNLSMLSLVETIRDVEKRRRMAEVLKIRHTKVEKEAERLDFLGEDIFEIFGASKLELM